MSTAIETSRQFRDAPIVDPIPASWKPPDGDARRDPFFEPEEEFRQMRESRGNIRFALFSGGYDSLVSTHWAMENGEADAVLHANTLTAIPENTEFVKEVCWAYGWPLRVIESPKTLKEFCLSTRNGEPYGFPGGGAHSIAFRWFKERAFREAAKANPERRPDLITGVRQHESDRRMKTVSAEVQETDRFIWKAPLWKKTDQWMSEYMQKHDLPRSIVVEVLDRSGDCFCGAYADRLRELDRMLNPWGHLHHAQMVKVRHLFSAGQLSRIGDALRDHHDWLLAVEEQVQERIGTSEGYCYWGHPAESSEALRTLKAENSECQVMLCESCGESEPAWQKDIEDLEVQRADETENTDP